MDKALRILHTSDWHLGKTIGGHRRWDEQEQFIEEIALLARDEGVHLVLLAGDVFDTENPPARAEELYFDALSRLAVDGRQVVVIAGNHDQPERLAAPAPLAVRQGVHILGRPGDVLPPGPGVLKSGPSYLVLQGPGWPCPAVILALPYPSEARLGELLTPSLEEAAERQAAYSRRVAAFLKQLAGFCRPGAVNLAVSHLYMYGGQISDSERTLSLGGAYSVDPGAFPREVQYVALGHLHRPQEVVGAPVPCRYSGSPLAYSFSEAGQAKGVVLVEAFPGRPVHFREITLNSGRPLVRWRATGGYEEVLAWCRAGRDERAWIDLEVHAAAPLTREQVEQLREMRPGIIDIRTVLPEQEGEAAGTPDVGALPLDELFKLFYRQQTGGGEPPTDLVRIFLELLEPAAEERGDEVEAG
ncbi:exonuclease SbcCD subunit D [Desulfofundulus thermosubterraneus]|uniref:Nuclease SbcCD subunit D n=1 Tax=Desulfofundulus thermosubterraneus DSM 16057 TaxID=1121432 RepID=A0A1M6H9T6_9FIRM|nr:exonuclease SbcCD subunit D [Desulfofundulus thermosubterraneus]SHJ19002.1 Exodeoxyribonuclease I subunit D [Desulfofundulus thermosubterraneus DSM 16057]